jgi:two-component system osmolarity sensor histidine kinase EnvZ
VSLFWRTFSLLSLLLAACLLAWGAALQALELNPRAEQQARELASLVQLARAALRETDGINRVALLKSLDQGQPTRVRPREPADRIEVLGDDPFALRVVDELRARLGPEVTVARAVNGIPGLWVDFGIERDRFWLHASPAEFAPGGATLGIWLAVALVATLAGSVGVARLINRPLQELSFAASRIRGGDLDSRLDEDTVTQEVREVNRGFNRMARELARVEQDRALMLAGISHDLRTPLARLRLDIEMSVSDEQARRHMAADIEQLDAIVGKFTDYARTPTVTLEPIFVASMIDRASAAFRDRSQIRVDSRVAIDLMVMADEVELDRVWLNLLENARRYGRTPHTGVAEVSITSRREGPWAEITLRDHGPGAPEALLDQLTTPFVRGDAARTADAGTGLGLAVVARTVAAMGGTLALENAAGGGFVARVRLRRAA